MTQNKTDQPFNVEDALKNHDIASRKYHELKDKLSTYHQQLVDHRNKSAAAWAEYEEAGKAWRKMLRDSNCEINQDTRKKKNEAQSAKELAEEIDLFIGESAIQYELKKLELYNLRGSYEVASQRARRAYGVQRLEETAREMIATKEGAAFFGELARTGLLAKGGESLSSEILRLLHALDFDTSKAEANTDTWVLLRGEPLSAFEIPRDTSGGGMLARANMRKSLIARQKSST